MSKDAKGAEETEPKTIYGPVKASAFQLCDNEGKMHASLGLTDSNQPIFSMYGKEGKPHLTLVLTGNGEPAIQLNHNGVFLSLFLIESSGMSSIVLGREDTGRKVMLLVSDETTAVAVFNENGEPSSALSLDDDGNGQLNLNLDRMSKQDPPVASEDKHNG